MKDIMVTTVTVTRQSNFASSVNNVFFFLIMYFFHEKNILEGYNFSTLHGKGGKKKQKHQNKSIHLLN